jgi:integrase
VLQQTLRKHRKEQLKQGLVSPERLIFTTADGNPLDRHNVRNQGIWKAAEKAGLSQPDLAELTTHDLRRTFISH